MREGHPPSLGWPAGKGPADYEAAANEFTDLLLKIKDTMTLELFTRYRLTSVLDLFQKDRPRFNELVEKGRTEPRTHEANSSDVQRLDLRGTIKLPLAKTAKMLDHFAWLIPRQPARHASRHPAPLSSPFNHKRNLNNS